MNSGKACKNLTDGVVLAVALVALGCLVIAFLGFEGQYLMDHPLTGDEVRVEKPLDDPYVSTELKLFIAFGICAVIGFGSRKHPAVSIVASVCTIVISLNYYADKMIGDWGFLFVIAGVLSLAGNLIFTYFHYKENENAGKKLFEKLKNGKEKAKTNK